MSDNFDQQWTSDHQQRLINESPGVVEANNDAAIEQADELRVANEKVISLDNLPTSPLSDAYDWGQRELDSRQNGEVRRDGWLENKYYKKNQKYVFGYDVSNGTRVMGQYNDEDPDVQGLMGRGIKGISESTTHAEDGPDPEGMKSLGSIATAARLSGVEDYQAFAQQVRAMEYPESAVQAAWNVGTRVLQRREVNEYLNETPENAEVIQPPAPDLSRDDLLGDDNWQIASKILYKAEEKREFDGTATDLMDWTINEMSNYNWRTWTMGNYAVKAMNRGGEYAQALSYLVNTYDRLPTDMDIFGKSLGAFATDPLNLVGAGAIGKGVAVAVAKSRMKKLLSNAVAKNALVGGVAGAVEVPVFGVAFDWSRQQVDIAAGNQDEYDIARTAGVAAISVPIGLAAGTGLGAVLSKPALQWYGRVGRKMLDNAKSGRSVGPMQAQRGYIGIRDYKNINLGGRKEGLAERFLLDHGYREAEGKPAANNYKINDDGSITAYTWSSGPVKSTLSRKTFRNPTLKQLRNWMGY